MSPLFSDGEISIRCNPFFYVSIRRNNDYIVTFVIPSASWASSLMNSPKEFALVLVLSASCPVCSPSAVTLVA